MSSLAIFCNALPRSSFGDNFAFLHRRWFGGRSGCAAGGGSRLRGQRLFRLGKFFVSAADRLIENFRSGGNLVGMLGEIGQNAFVEYLFAFVVLVRGPFLKNFLGRGRRLVLRQLRRGNLDHWSADGCGRFNLGANGFGLDPA